MQDFKPNPSRFSESKQGEPTPAEPMRPRVEKVVMGKVTTKPKSEVSKFFEGFFAGDIRKVKEYVTKEVLMPTLKDTIWTIIAKGSERLIYGESGHSPKNSKLPFINYGGLFKSNTTPAAISTSTTNQYSVDDIIVDDEDDAKRVLAAMNEYIVEFGSVSISELREFIGEPIGDFNTTRWGWRSINTASYSPTGDGRFKLNLPRAVSIKK